MKDLFHKNWVAKFICRVLAIAEWMAIRHMIGTEGGNRTRVIKEVEQPIRSHP